jgi:methionine synthase I (cobalamin-dependent)
VVVCATTTDGSREDRKRVDELLSFLAGEGDDQVEPGLNCCRGPYEALRVALALPVVPRWIKPSTGDPGDPASDHVMAAFARAARMHGARFLGGCCGTREDSLTAMGGALGFLDGRGNGGRTAAAGS